MKGVVTKRLNKRVQGASVNAGKLKPYEVGEVVEIVEILNGDDIDGNNVWYRLDDGTYVWSGGIAGDREIPGVNINLNSEAMNYNTLFTTIPESIRTTKGKGVKVAILDSGVFANHEQLSNSSILFEDNNDYSDETGHGSHLAGIIGANGSELVGIAPECEMYISKIVSVGKGNYYESAFARGLKWAIDVAKVDVINLSFSLYGVEKNTEIVDLMKKASKKNIYIVGSAGENSILKASMSFFYPAKFPECFSVGGMTTSYHKKNSSIQFAKDLDLIMPKQPIISLSNKSNDLVNKQGSSMSSAFVSGIAALIKSSNPSISNETLTKQILGYAKSLDANSNLNDKYQLFTP